MVVAETNTTKVLVSTPSRELADTLLKEKFPHAHQFEMISKAHDSPTTVHITIEITSPKAARPIATWLCEQVKKYHAEGTKIEGRTCPGNEAEIILLVHEIIAATDKERSSDLEIPN